MVYEWGSLLARHDNISLTCVSCSTLLRSHIDVLYYSPSSEPIIIDGWLVTRYSVRICLTLQKSGWECNALCIGATSCNFLAFRMPEIKVLCGRCWCLFCLLGRSFIPKSWISGQWLVSSFSVQLCREIRFMWCIGMRYLPLKVEWSYWNAPRIPYAIGQIYIFLTTFLFQRWWTP